MRLKAKRKTPTEIGVDLAAPGSDTTGLIFFYGSQMLLEINLERVSKMKPDRELPRVFHEWHQALHEARKRPAIPDEVDADAFADVFADLGIRVDGTVLLKAWRRRFG